MAMIALGDSTYAELLRRRPNSSMRCCRNRARTRVGEMLMIDASENPEPESGIKSVGRTLWASLFDPRYALPTRAVNAVLAGVQCQSQISGQNDRFTGAPRSWLRANASKNCCHSAGFLLGCLHWSQASPFHTLALFLRRLTASCSCSCFHFREAHPPSH